MSEMDSTANYNQTRAPVIHDNAYELNTPIVANTSPLTPGNEVSDDTQLSKQASKKGKWQLGSSAHSKEPKQAFINDIVRDEFATV